MKHVVNQMFLQFLFVHESYYHSLYFVTLKTVIQKTPVTKMDKSALCVVILGSADKGTLNTQKSERKLRLVFRRIVWISV